MKLKLDIIQTNLLAEFIDSVDFDIDDVLNKVSEEKVPADYFKFYTSISSVYSSKIEGEDIDFDSFFKHKFMNVPFEADYTKKADDLMNAYEFALTKELNLENILESHKILSSNLLPKSQRGLIRTNPMFVINEQDRIEYIAAEPKIVNREMERLIADIDLLLKAKLSSTEIFYYASLVHLVFVKIHPFQDGNGRMARLIEKWFLVSKLGEKAISVGLEKNYYRNLSLYYQNIKKLGLEYIDLDYSKSLAFLKMTTTGLKLQLENHN